VVRVSVLGIYVFSIYIGKFGEVERLTVVVVEMVVGWGGAAHRVLGKVVGWCK
jgi:hypothetical protein